MATTTPAARAARARFRKLLARQLEPVEVKTILHVLKAELRGKHFRATRLGVAESLVRRNWLVRDSAGNVSLSSATRQILSDCEAAG